MQSSRRFALAVAIFVVAYVCFLVIWIQAKSYYGRALTGLAAPLAGMTAGFRITESHHGDDIAALHFTRPVMTRKGMGDVDIDLKISTSNYTFNVPLTLALVASLFPFFRWRKRYLLEAMSLLVCVHLLYIYSYCVFQLYYQMSQKGVETPSAPVRYFLEFTWAFTDNMIIRFEPFLISIYLWLRNARRQRTVKTKKGRAKRS